MISLEKFKILTPLQKLPKNVGDLGKLIVTKCFKNFQKSNKSPNLVTLSAEQLDLGRSKIGREKVRENFLFIGPTFRSAQKFISIHYVRIVPLTS